MVIDSSLRASVGMHYPNYGSDTHGLQLKVAFVMLLKKLLFNLSSPFSFGSYNAIIDDYNPIRNRRLGVGFLN